MIDGRGNFLRESKRNFPNSKIIFKKIIGLKSNYYSKLNEFDFGEVDVLCGANMIVKNLTYKKIDGFNNDYFMFGEDIELSYRFKNIGYCNFYDGNMTIVHFKGESTKTNINYLKNFYGAMEIYYQNIFSSNRFLLFMIKIISKFLIFINVLMPKKHNINFQTAKNILFSNKLNPALDKRFEGIILKSKIDKSFENCNLILDPNYLTFKQIIKTLNMLKNGNNINFWFLSKDSSYMLRSGDMNQKGNVIFL
jgi:GT2 family glycosyltransferase